ncbi:type II toxin-antitoxin system VapC family toxin [Brevundimonas sp.]|uniref:type II toxin-antitoxin system VapC family toxin n=1 Tax=Brevundimonas sp. TaxID=1871086 RepID=UPI002FDA97B0
MYLLDSDICVRLLRNRSRAVAERLNAHAGDLFTSSIVRHELMHGALMSGRPTEHREAVEALLARLAVLEFDASAADHAADIKADLQRRGLMIGANDLLIAGHARSRSLIVVTGNLREFERVAGLRCEDWPAGPAGPHL